MNFSIAFPWLRNSGRAGYPCLVLLYRTWAFAPGLSFPYPSRRLITPHTPTPAPIAVTTVLSPVTDVVKKLICLSPFSKNKREPCVSSFYIKAPCVLVSYSVVPLLDIVTKSYSAISPTSHTSSTTSFLLKRSLLRFLTYFSMSNSFFLS